MNVMEPPLKHPQQQQQQQRHLFNQRSCELTKAARRNRLREIFDVMDKDGDGFISADKIEILPLATHVLRALKPLFEDLEMFQLKLNFEQFAEAATIALEVRGGGRELYPSSIFIQTYTSP